MAIVFSCVGISNCNKNDHTLQFSILDKDGKQNVVSKEVTDKHIDSLFSTNLISEFWKLELKQKNGDNLIVEQKDKEGYLVLIKIRYEQFVIQEQPNTSDDLKLIMKNYILKGDEIMNNTKFY